MAEIQVGQSKLVTWQSLERAEPGKEARPAGPFYNIFIVLHFGGVLSLDIKF